MKITVSEAFAEVTELEQLTSGMIGKTIDAEFSSDWDGLIKVAVFSNGEIAKDVINPSGTITIPWEVLAVPHKTVSVGFYGYTVENGEKVLAIPTIYADLGNVRRGADPSNDPSAEVSPKLGEQLQADISGANGRIDGNDSEIADHEQRITYLEGHGGGGGAIISVNGKTGAVILDAADVGATTEAWVNEQGFLKEQLSLSAYRTAAEQDAIDNAKVDKAAGKGLSANDYTSEDKAKVASAIQPSDLDDYAKTADVPTQLSQLSGDSTHRVVTDAEKARWDAGSGEGFDIHTLTTENSLADSDEMAFHDVSASTPRKTTWSNIKAKLKTYFDTLYIGATSLVGYATQAWVQSQDYGTYTKPSGGIPKTDLANDVQTSLSRADTAVQPEDITDRVVERGISGIWVYKKWDSGDAECWLKDGYTVSETPTTMTANGTLYESNIMTLALPTGLFADVPNVSLDTLQGGGMWFKITGSTNKDEIKYELLRTNNTISSNGLTAQCKGRWK